MWERFREWVRRWLGMKLPDEPSPEKYVRQYEDVNAENITSTIANKLAMLTFADSGLTVKDKRTETPGARVQMIADTLVGLWEVDAVSVTAQAFGKGGKVLVPVVHDGHVEITVIDHTRLQIREQDAHRITAASLLVDALTYSEKRYFLMADYQLQDGVQVTRYRAVDADGAVVELSAIPKWQSIEPELTISGVDRLLFAYLRCPTDNRRDDKRYGVPITYGAENDIAELVEHISIYRREYKLARAMLGLDATLWRDSHSEPGKPAKPVDIKAIRKSVQDSDDPFVPFDSRSLDGSGVWQHYAPPIRHEAMEVRYSSLCRRIEKACGLSQGILTERQSLNYANKDEVRAAQYDTFAVIQAMRTEWEQVLDDLAYSIDVLCERFGLTPSGGRDQWEIATDWDTSLIESTAEAFSQMRDLHSAGLVRDAELRQWVMGGTLEAAEEAVEQIRTEKAQSGGNALDSLLGRLTGGEE